MEYEMGLHEKYFNFMKFGTKKIEIRLNDEKRRKLKVGDTIYFLKEPNRKQKLKTKITKITKYDNFIDLLEVNKIEDLASINVSKNELLQELDKIYKREEQDKYGVVAIEIEKQEKSCGMIIFKDEKILLVHHNSGHWGLPKGHVEANETEIETAKREVFEETGVIASKIGDYREVITYSPKINTIKDVVFFIGEAKNDDIKPQESEVQEVKYVEIENIDNYITHNDEKDIIKKAINYYYDKVR